MAGAGDALMPSSSVSAGVSSICMDGTGFNTYSARSEREEIKDESITALRTAAQVRTRTTVSGQLSRVDAATNKSRTGDVISSEVARTSSVAANQLMRGDVAGRRQEG